VVEKPIVVLPDEPTPASFPPPADIIIAGFPKCGKSTALADLSLKRNALILDLDPGDGYAYLTAKKIGVKGKTKYETYKNYLAVREALIQSPGKYDFIIIDSLSELNELAVIGGTYSYMQSPQSKKGFNRNLEGKAYTPDDPQWKGVDELPEGYGYRYIREWFTNQINIFRSVAKYRIYVTHFLDKTITPETVTEAELNTRQLNLIGKLKFIFPINVTSICAFKVKGNERYLSFEFDSDSPIVGSRDPRLQGEILISKKDGDKIETYWEKVYGQEGIKK
jgi:hypothetical protein